MAPKGESDYLFGIHDRGGEAMMAEAGYPGWVLVNEVVGRDVNNTNGGSYQDLVDQGFGAIVQLQHGAGTLPLAEYYDNFAVRCANFVENSTGCHTWIIGRQPNAESSRPEQGTAGEELITPQLYARCYKKCRHAIRSRPGHEEDMVLVAAVAPYNSQTAYPPNKEGDWVRYQQDVLLVLGTGNFDGVAIHAYTHGSSPDLIENDLKMNPPFANRHYDFKTYQDLMAIIPPKVPAFITEACPKSPSEHVSQSWPEGNEPGGWVQAAYREIDGWNQKHPERHIRSLILYRWSDDTFSQPWYAIKNHPVAVEDFRQALTNEYRWSSPPLPEYRTNFLSQNTPPSFAAGDTMSVPFHLSNDGTRTWGHDGENPCRLGSHWYDSDNREVLVSINYHNSLSSDVQPGQETKLIARTMTPTVPGRYRLRWEMLHEGVGWFGQQGDQTQTLMVEVLPATLPFKPPVEDIIEQLPVHDTRHYFSRELDRIESLVVHHSVVPPTVDVYRIARHHVDKRGWPGLGYHFFVNDDGHLQQAQPLEIVSYHTGDPANQISVGICLAGDFTRHGPPQAQMTATAQLLAWLLDRLNLPLEAIHGHCDYRDTQCPGRTWASGWRDRLLDDVREILGEAYAVTPTKKVMEHYLLFWQSGDDWAREEWLSAEEYVGRFRVTMGFSLDDAKYAHQVTIVGGSGGVQAEAEARLRAAGCRVERIPGDTARQVKQVLDQLVASDQPFLSGLK